MKILRVETNPMLPHQAAAYLRVIARELSEARLDQDFNVASADVVWSFESSPKESTKLENDLERIVRSWESLEGQVRPEEGFGMKRCIRDIRGLLVNK